jgi:hypothetical protein
MPYLSRERFIGDGVLGSDVVRHAEMQQHLMELVLVGQRSSSQIDTRLTTVVHCEEQPLSHVAQVTTHLPRVAPNFKSKKIQKGKMSQM